MKAAKIFIILSLILAATFGCKKDEEGELGTPYGKIEAMPGTWKISKIFLLDEIAYASGGTQVQLEITDWYPFDEFVMTFTLNNGQPGTFNVDAGNAPNWMITSGTWNFNDISYPTEIILTAGDGSGKTTTLGLVAPPREGTPLRFKLQKYCGGSPMLSYVYTLEKQ